MPISRHHPLGEEAEYSDARVPVGERGIRVVVKAVRAGDAGTGQLRYHDDHEVADLHVHEVTELDDPDAS
jgi:hypothetical protein